MSSFHSTEVKLRKPDLPAPQYTETDGTIMNHPSLNLGRHRFPSSPSPAVHNFAPFPLQRLFSGQLPLHWANREDRDHVFRHEALETQRCAARGARAARGCAARRCVAPLSCREDPFTSREYSMLPTKNPRGHPDMQTANGSVQIRKKSKGPCKG